MELRIFVPQFFKLRSKDRGQAASNVPQREISTLSLVISYLALQLLLGTLELLQQSLAPELLLHQSTFLFCHLLKRLSCFARSLSGLNNGSTGDGGGRRLINVVFKMKQ